MVLERLKEEEIKQILSLIARGKSLNYISNKLNKSKTTVYYHFRKVKGRTMNPPRIKSKNQEIIGEFIGLFAGDGSYTFDKKQYRHTTRLFFNVNEKPFVDSLIKNTLTKLLGKKPVVFRRNNVLVLGYYSKEVYNLIKNYLFWDPESRKTHTVRLFKTNHSKPFMMGFVRGSLDSDGYFSKKKISFASVSKDLMENVSVFLKKLEIKHDLRVYIEKRKNRNNLYYINVRKPEREKFISLIKPRNVKF
ncbi:MAG: LAGLIDADG family homing endonuclease [Candidatus Nanoarchaeia archaeon]|nr:LAGLIDADG family homing endonuclease [Candidatus Nanoarchaeia archaeon]